MNLLLIGCAITFFIAYFVWLARAVRAQEADRRENPEYYKMLDSISMSESSVETLMKNARYEAKHGARK